MRDMVRRAGLAVLSCLALTVGGALATPARAADSATVNPFSPAAGHPYRHGAVPTREAAARMRAYRAAHPAADPAPAASGANLRYGGGVDGIGVTTGSPKVYLIFWGSQWGTPSSDANGNTTLSGDALGMAPRLQQLFKGIGVNGELWSGVTTQYCEGVATGAQTCPDTAPHVGYPTGGALAGVWADNATAAPGSATEHEIGVEAVAAASHFGNTNAALNRDAQYVVVSAHGTHPDNFPSAGFCAWHDWNGDGTLIGGPIPSTVGDIAFTNLPYVTDAGGSCGANFVNTGGAGILDGVTIVEGHEYAETITDQNPAGGWIDAGGEENADKCAWLGAGPGAIANVPFATGSLAMQSTWSNDAANGTGGCLMTHPIVGGGGGNDFTIGVGPNRAAVTAGRTATLTAGISTVAAPGFTESVTLTVAGLPTGVTAAVSPQTVVAGGSATLTLHASGATPIGVYVLAVTGTAPSATRVASYSLAVVAPTGAVANGTFESGLSGWTATGLTTIVDDPVHSGFAAVKLGAFEPTRDNVIKQTFTVRSGQTKLTFFYMVQCTDIVQLDWFTVTLRDNTTRRTVTLVPHTCDLRFSFTQVNAPVKAGHSYTLTFTDHDDHATGDGTWTFIDDVSTS
jgi:serine protease